MTKWMNESINQLQAGFLRELEQKPVWELGQNFNVKLKGSQVEEPIHPRNNSGLHARPRWQAPLSWLATLRTNSA